MIKDGSKNKSALFLFI